MKILIIEDDLFVAKVYQTKFSTEGFQVEVAADGLAGLEMAHSFHPDAVILDLMLPKMTGVELVKKLRSEPTFEKLPIIVFSNTYLTNMVQEAWKAGATKCLSKASCSPRQLIEVVRGVLPEPIQQSISEADPVSAPVVKAPVPTPHSALRPPSPDPDAQFQSDLRKSCIESLPTTLAGLRLSLQAFSRAETEPARLSQVHEMYQRIRALAGNAGVADLPQIARMSDAFEALLQELHEKPKNLTASTLRTMATAVDFLGILFKRGLASAQYYSAPPNILVVDDEAISRRAVVCALERAKLQSVNVEDPAVAYEQLLAKQFDLIFLDVDMPGMNGFELCTKLRALPAYKKTPVVFVTALNDFESRANSSMSGGNDFIAKPFLFPELAVKALVYVLRDRLQPALGTKCHP